MRYTGSFRHLCFMSVSILSLILVQSIFAAQCPCDIYATGGTPCVAAHSTVRALYGTYNGPLYQVTRKSDKATRDIGVVTPGGLANSAAQDSFLNGAAGNITIIYDQSANGNKLTPAAAGYWPPAETAAAAATAKIMLNGHTVYGIYTTMGNMPGSANVNAVGYRNDHTVGMATGDQPEGMYMVCSGTHYNQYCCFDYGNAQTNDTDDGNATMECIYFGNSTQWGHGAGKGPWVMADLENGMVAGGATGIVSSNTAITANYVTGVIKGKSGNYYAIRGGNADSGNLKTMYAGTRPSGYSPMKKQGAIILGIGGDNSHTGAGTFFEGAITTGYPSDTTDSLVQANILAARYGLAATPVNPSVSADKAAPLFTVSYNPAKGSAVISYTLQESRKIRMAITDLQGRHIALIADETMAAGRHNAVWNASRSPSGIYLCKIAIDGMESRTEKILLGK